VSSSKFKVTDKRRFTADGTLREEYRHLEREGTPESSSPPAAPPVEEAPEAAVEAPPPRAPEPPEEDRRGGPGFLDLVMMLAEPATIYLGEARLPDGSTQENLQLAALHIEFLDILRRKTVGNLDAQEAAVLEDVLYQLRTRYVQKRGGPAV
jgi:hypothetical protein